jgi:putative flavoprotein involved in K+ transport
MAVSARTPAKEQIMVETREVVVIGAGPAGLACAAVLHRSGVDAVVLERASAPGASWRGHYDGLRLNTSRWFSHLPGRRFPLRAGVFPSRDEVVRYVDDYASQPFLNIRYRTNVDRVDALEPDDGAAEPRWIVRTTDLTLQARHLVIATGLLQAPLMPPWPGCEEYSGTLIPASEYRNPAAFQGRDVVVVGAGCSGMEIAADLAGGGAGQVFLAVRTPPNILLRSVAGIPGDPAAMILRHVAARTADAVLAPVRLLTIGDLTRYGLPAPAEGPFAHLKRTGCGPAVVDRPVLRHIRSGRIRVVAAVVGLDAGGTVLADGSRIRADAVIAATGHQPGLGHLVGHLGVLDERGRPRAHAGTPASPGMWFIGFRSQPGQLGALGGEARLVARNVAARPRR